jgi:hypothetical protein
MLAFLPSILPTFKGKPGENSKMFVTTFKRTVQGHVYSLSDEQVLDIFIMWLQDKAKEWAYRILDKHLNVNPDGTDWSIDVWFSKLQEKFPCLETEEDEIQEASYRNLEEIKLERPVTVKSLREYNLKFKSVLADIPGDMKTESLTVELYKRVLSKAMPEIFKSVEKNIIRNNARPNLSVIMNLFVQELMVQEKLEREMELDGCHVDEQLASLTKLVGDLTLQISQDRSKPRVVTCFNCGERGHVSRDCLNFKSEFQASSCHHEYNRKYKDEY